MLRKILKAVGIILLFILVLVAAIFLTFPTDSIRHLLETKIEKALKYEQGIEIKELSISPLLNVTVKGVEMTPRVHEEMAENLATAGGEFDGYFCAPYVEEQAITIDELFVNPSIFKIIRKKPEGKFELKIQDGTIAGELRSNDKLFDITAEGRSIELDTFAPLSNLTRAQIYGELSFEVSAVIDSAAKKGANMVQGLNAVVHANGTAMCPKRIKLNVSSMPFIEMPFTVFGDIELEAELDNDKVIIHHLTSTGPDIQLDVKGSVTLKSDKNRDVRLDITADILPSQAWIDSNNMNAIYKLCEKHDDGSIKLKLSGTTKRLKHDCGTPIPDPEPEVAPSDDAAKSAEADKKDEDKPEARPNTENARPKPREDSAETSDKSGDSAGKAEKKNPVRELGRSPSGLPRVGMNNRETLNTRSMRQEGRMRETEFDKADMLPPRPLPMHDNPRMNEINQKVEGEIMREMQRSPRGRERIRARERERMSNE